MLSAYSSSFGSQAAFNAPCVGHKQWRRQGEMGGSFPLWVDVQKLCNNVCAFTVMELCTAVNVSASGGLRTLDPLWTHTSLPPPCYKILAAPLVIRMTNRRRYHRACTPAILQRTISLGARPFTHQRGSDGDKTAAN